MYTIKNITRADAGHVLKYKNRTAYYFEGIDPNEITEVEVNLENMKKSGEFVKYSGNLMEHISCTDYGSWKSKIIGKQFNNNDQIAIMLNKDDSDEDMMLFVKMQEWRAWASIVAKKIMSIL